MYSKKISYIAEINLDSKSAYKQQVLKMCDAFSQNGYEVKLYIINSNKINFNQLKKEYILKKKFKIISIFKYIKKLNFFLRVLFALKIFFLLKKKEEIIYSRSVLTSIFFSIFGLKNILEIHQPNSGITKFLFNTFKSQIIKKTQVILINKKLNNHLLLNKQNYIISDDGVDIKDFKKNYKILHDKSCVYTGSLFPGKGIEIIIELAKKMKDFSFHVYGEINSVSKRDLDQCKNLKNIKLLGYINYFKIPKILKSHKIIIMPYLKSTFGNHKTMDISKYMSPLKLFDYLASGRVIIASRNESYSHILVNKKNCFLCNPNNIDEWVKKIKKVSSKHYNVTKIQYNSLKTAKSYTWRLRVLKIIQFVKENNILIEKKEI